MQSQFSKLVLSMLFLVWMNQVYAGLNERGYWITPLIFNESPSVDVQRNYIYGNQPLANLKGEPGGSDWIVFSDRENNPVLNSKGSPIGGTFKFREKLKVVGINDQNGLLEVERENRGNWATAGYVSRENVLLTSFALLNQNGLLRHAMVCMTIPDYRVRDRAKLFKDYKDRNKYYASPVEDVEDGFTSKYDVYFVLKQIGGKVLLSRTDNLQGDMQRFNSPGWILEVHLTFWDSRVCLEPNYGQEILNFGKNNVMLNDGIPVLRTLDEIKTMDKGVNEAIVNFPVSNEQLGNCEWRLPILDISNSTDNTNYSNYSNYKVAAIVDLLGDNKGNKVNETKILNKIREATKRMQNVNILFVIDGTSSMKSYFTPIAKAIQDLKDNSLLKSLTLSMGCAIYRDYADASLRSRINPKYNRDFELLPLTENLNEVQDFLYKSFTTPNNINSIGKDEFEALYMGLDRGISEAGFKSNESNVVILVGDCGDDEQSKEYTRNKVVDLMNKFKIQLMSYQVNNRNSPPHPKLMVNAYLKYTLDMIELSKMCANKVLTSSSGNRLFKWEQDLEQTNTYNLEYVGVTKDITPYIYKYAYADQRMGTVGVGRFQNNVSITVQTILDNTQLNINYLKDLLQSGSGKKTGAGAVILMENLGISKDEIKNLAEMGNFSMQGYATRKIKQLNNGKLPMYKFALYFTHEEVNKYTKHFREIPRRVKSGGTLKKKALRDAIVTMVNAMAGNEANNMNILNYDLNYIWEEYLGVRFSTKYSSIGSKKLSLWTKDGELDAVEFDLFYDEFMNQCKAFGNSKFDNYCSYEEDQNMRKYWVDMEKFPGCSNIND